jgi:hypothetical protein
MPKVQTLSKQRLPLQKTLEILFFKKLQLIFLLNILCLAVNAQDQVFLRSDEGMLDCYIININDTVIIFRTLDPSDTTEYEIPIRDTYGYVLEDVNMHKQLVSKEQEYYIKSWNEKKRRQVLLKEEKGIYFRMKSDTSLFPRRGKIVQLHPDTVWIEQKKKGKLERNPYLFTNFEMLGYTTFWTELATLIVIPTSTVKEGSLQFYRKMTLNKGWQWKMELVNEAIAEKKIKRRYRPGKSFKLPKSVKRKTRNKG